MKKKRVLFVCIHNSARSQMAEELLRKMAGDQFDVRSAGIEPGRLNPWVVEVLQEDGIDISQKATKSVQEVLKKDGPFDYVVTVCDEASAERCPVVSGATQRLHWSFPDPSQFQGTDQEKKAQIRRVKEEICRRIEIWLKEFK